MMSGYKLAFKKAFPYTIPVLTGYLFIGIAFGVMYAEKGYSLLCLTKTQEGVEEDKFMFAIVLLNQIYWVVGSAVGSILKNALSFNAKGIDFAMAALFVVIFTEQWMEVKNRMPELIGVISAILCLQLFGSTNFALPTMILMVTHDAFSVCHCGRILFMRDGEIVSELHKNDMDNRDFLQTVLDELARNGGGVLRGDPSIGDVWPCHRCGDGRLVLFNGVLRLAELVFRC